MCKQSRDHDHVSLRNFTAVGGMGDGGGPCSVKYAYGSESLKKKNNSNEMILIGFFLKVKGDFRFLEV